MSNYSELRAQAKDFSVRENGQILEYSAELSDFRLGLAPAVVFIGSTKFEDRTEEKDDEGDLQAVTYSDAAGNILTLFND